jgi:hypothetical protein
MNHHIARHLALVLVFSALLALAAPGRALAHGHIEVGDYELVIGFRNEPAIQSEPNGLDLRVTNIKTGEPVPDLADTLTAEISFGGSTLPLELRPQWGQEGAYTADVIPTAAGDYTFRIAGTIEGTPVDVTMTSGPDTFSAVGAKEALAFPAAEPTPAELQAQAQAAAASAQTALLVGGLGVLAGLAGLGVALAALRSRRDTAGAPSARRTV